MNLQLNLFKDTLDMCLFKESSLKKILKYKSKYFMIYHYIFLFLFSFILFYISNLNSFYGESSLSLLTSSIIGSLLFSLIYTLTIYSTISITCIYFNLLKKSSKITFNHNFKIQISSLLNFTSATYLIFLISYLILSNTSGAISFLTSTYILLILGGLFFTGLVIWYICVQTYFLSKYNNLSKIKTFLIIILGYLSFKLIMYILFSLLILYFNSLLVF